MAQARPDYNLLSEVNSCYQNSMTFVTKALELDESGNKSQAVEFYLKALEFIENGVRVDISRTEYNGPEWDDARAQQQKMAKAQMQTQQRLYALEGGRMSQQGSNDTNLPAYSAQPPEGHVSLSSVAISGFDVEGTTELLTIPGGVQIFFVSEDQHVGTTPPSYPTFLRVLVVNDTEQTFLQVNDWTYPLTTGQTPVLKTANGAYIFPNLVSNTITQGSVGIVISNDVDHGLIELFENVLQNLALFRSQDKLSDKDSLDVSESLQISDEVAPSTSDKIANGLEQGAGWISHGLRQGATYTGDLVKKGSDKLKENLTPNDNPSTVNPNVQKGLYYTHEASKAAVKVTRFLVDGLCAITSKVGQEVAPHIKEYSKKILPESATTKDKNGESTVDGAIKVAGAGLSSFSTIWTELEKSGLLIARAVSSATVENVEFKYGKDAGVATSHAMGSAVNVGKTAFNLDNLGMKAIAKRAAKDTGKAVLGEYSVEKNSKDEKSGENEAKKE